MRSSILSTRVSKVFSPARFTAPLLAHVLTVTRLLPPPARGCQ